MKSFREWFLEQPEPGLHDLNGKAMHYLITRYINNSWDNRDENRQQLIKSMMQKYPYTRPEYIENMVYFYFEQYDAAKQEVRKKLHKREIQDFYKWFLEQPEPQQAQKDRSGALYLISDYFELTQEDPDNTEDEIIFCMQSAYKNCLTVDQDYDHIRKVLRHYHENYLKAHNKQLKLVRPDWDTYFMQMADLAKTRSTCLRRQVGAVLVKDNRVLSTGYNGAPRGCTHCGENGTPCLREQLKIPSGERHEICRAIHGEQNAIVQAAYHGVSINGATLYTSLVPCSLCTKLIINAGIVRVVYRGEYNDALSLPMLKEAGIKLTKVG